MEYKSKGNHFYVILSTSIVLFFLGLFLLVLLHSQHLVDILKEKAIHVVELKNTISDSEKAEILSFLEAQEYIVPSSVGFIPKEEAYKSLGLTEENTSLNGGLNPFSDVISYQLLSTFSDRDKLKQELQVLNGVEKHYSQNIFYEQIKTNLLRLGWVLLILAIIFGVLAFALIYSTLNLQLYSDRFEIKTMELVGAEDDFIVKPYIAQSLRVGFLSSLIAAIFLIIFYVVTGASSGFFAEILQFQWMFLTIVIISLVAMLFLTMSNKYLIKRYLSKQIRDLYN